ncbi:Thiamine-phosphate synthase [Dyadobacter sp. CECT 9275]|uniref:Thiamine-phosphate synthase n=1 Tax=Dyadobacter helix TaxID=2822344 RepID=A0A916N4Z4_9BACT|nr:thiamine phosphate synthase [Dyadobacter sp. CECT 9275]CAG4994295.1 Thiamine-phosphate synthase [Dyadobacter sp. CECT 9275]
MKLIVISSPVYLPNEAGCINLLFENGMEYLHLRKPDGTASDLDRLLRGICPAFLSKIAVHQHFPVALEYGIRRLHFPENLRMTTDESTLMQMKSEGFILSTSIHKLLDTNILTSFDYTFFGPVYNSISKPGYQGILPPGFRLDAAEKKLPVIGLGGIDQSNIRNIKEMNFDGAAVSGTLWKNPAKAPQTFIQLNNVLNQ